MKVKFIYWFAYYNLDSPSVRYRGKYPCDKFKEEHNIGSYFVVPSYNPFKILFFLKAYFSALFWRKEDSIIVLQRVHSNFIYSNLLRLLVKIQKTDIVYDLDDVDYLENPPKSIFNFIKSCSKVTVDSKELVKNLARYNSNIVLNTSPTPDLSIAKKERNSTFTIGWIGCYGNGDKESLNDNLFPALTALPFPIKLILLGVHQNSDRKDLKKYFQHSKNVELEMPKNINWQSEVEIQNRITEFDLGIATLIDTELFRSKSAFKTKQYLNNGIPVLSSDISENNHFIRSGFNGFLCRNAQDFRDRIIEIYTMDDEAYFDLSYFAKKSIKHFKLSKYCDTLLSLFGNEIKEQKPLTFKIGAPSTSAIESQPSRVI